MPIVRTYGDIEGMGALALTAGSAQGRAQAMGQKRAQDTALLGQVVGAQQRRRASEYGADLDYRQAMAQMEAGREDREDQQAFQMERDAFQGQMRQDQDQAGFQQRQQLAEQSSQLSAQRQIDVGKAKQQAELDLLQKNLVRSGQAPSPEVAAQMASEIMVMQATPAGGRGGSSRVPNISDITGTTTGELGDFGATQAVVGNMEAVSRQIQLARNAPGASIPEPGKLPGDMQIINGAVLGLVSQAQAGNTAPLINAWQNQSTPPEIRQAIGGYVQQLGLTNYGSNQQGPGPISQGVKPGPAASGRSAPANVGAAFGDMGQMNSRDLMQSERQLQELLQYLRSQESLQPAQP
jgi:hypothetical protein